MDSSTNKKTILIVEDEAGIVQPLKEELLQAGFSVLTSDNGQLGLESSIKNHPDLILLDIKMPVMDGIEMLKKLRENMWGENVPVIILTNSLEAEAVSEALTHKAFDFLVKSDWKLSDVVKKVKAKLGMP